MVQDLLNNDIKTLNEFINEACQLAFNGNFFIKKRENSEVTDISCIYSTDIQNNKNTAIDLLDIIKKYSYDYYCYLSLEFQTIEIFITHKSLDIGEGDYDNYIRLENKYTFLT